MENFILHYDFVAEILSDQGHSFEIQLIANLCKLSGVQKIRTSPYHPQTNGKCDHSNSTLLNMFDILYPEHKKD